MKKYSWPVDHWHWPVELTHRHGVRSGPMIFTGGQADLDKDGKVINPENLTLQTNSVLDHVEAILTDLGAGLTDLVRLVIYFVGDSDAEKLILHLIGERLRSYALTRDSCKSQPTVCTVCLPELCYPGIRIELEGIAVCIDSQPDQIRQSMRIEGLPALPDAFAHVVRCGSLVFTSDISAIQPSGKVAATDDITTQTRIMMDQLTVALEAADAHLNDVLKLNVFYRGDGTAENWAEPARIRASYFADPGPAATGITVKHFAQPGLMTKIAVTASVRENTAEQIRYSWPEGHWNWTTPLPYNHGNRVGQLIHLGGQVALDANAKVLHPDNIVAQTHVALRNIETVLTDLGATINDVVKVTAFYQGNASAEGLHENLLIRSAAFKSPGPATSGIPVPHLVYEHMVIEIEVIAMVD